MYFQIHTTYLKGKYQYTVFYLLDTDDVIKSRKDSMFRDFPSENSCIGLYNINVFTCPQASPMPLSPIPWGHDKFNSKASDPAFCKIFHFSIWQQNTKYKFDKSHFMTITKGVEICNRCEENPLYLPKFSFILRFKQYVILQSPLTGFLDVLNLFYTKTSYLLTMYVLYPSEHNLVITGIVSLVLVSFFLPKFWMQNILSNILLFNSGNSNHHITIQVLYLLLFLNNFTVQKHIFVICIGIFTQKDVLLLIMNSMLCK